MNRIKNFFSKWNIDDVTLLYILAATVTGATLLLVLWFGYQFVFGRDLPGDIVILEDLPREEEIDKECDSRNSLNGVCLAEGVTQEQKKVFAVMVENHPDSRPQSGLAYADIVYEAPVEANYSRFMLIFDEDADITKIGPVRSARPYYLDWAQEYGDAMYVHVGGSPAALERIKDEQMNDLNEFYRGWYFWRANDRVAPHNVYTSTNLLGEALDKYASQYSSTAYDSWKFANKESCNENCIKEVTVTFLGSTYQAVWRYDNDTEQYERYQDGRLHRDQDGTKIVADTIVVQRVETKILDEIGRISMETIGGGDALIFSKGNVREVQWKKEDVDSRTRWIDESGKDVALQPGKIWVEVLNQIGDLSYE